MVVVGAVVVAAGETVGTEMAGFANPVNIEAELAVAALLVLANSEGPPNPPVLLTPNAAMVDADEVAAEETLEDMAEDADADEDAAETDMAAAVAVDAAKLNGALPREANLPDEVDDVGAAKPTTEGCARAV